MSTHEGILSQYLSALAMLEQAIERCPEDMWDDPQDQNKTWHVAYHTLFYTHLYAHTRGQDFQSWEHHREGYENMGSKSEPSHDPPNAGKQPYSKDEVLSFLGFCRDYLREQIPILDMEAESGFPWIPMNKLACHAYNLRHLQHHIGQITGRLRARAGVSVDWVIGRVP